MSDVAFIALTIVVFAVMAVVVRGVERLVGPAPSSARADSFGGEQGTEQPGEDRGDGSGGRSASVDGSSVRLDRVGAPPDGQVVT